MLTAASGPGAIGIIHALKSHPNKKIEVIAGCVDDTENGSILCTEDRVLIPYVSDPDFVQKMIIICTEQNINLIVPGFSQESLVLSKQINKFEEKGIKVLSPSFNVVDICHNKNKMLEYLSNNKSLYCMEYKVASNIHELVQMCLDLGYPNRKICVKPAVCSGGSRGFFILEDDYDRYENFFLKKDSHICTLEELKLKLQNITNLPLMLIMEYIEGEEFGIDIVAHDGEMAGCIIRKHLEPILASINMRMDIIKDKDMKELARYTAKLFSIDSLVNIDIIRAKKDGKLYILEINPRQGANIGLGVQHFNLMAMAIDCKYGDAFDQEVYKGNYNEIKGIRYIEEFAICDGEIVRYVK